MIKQIWTIFSVMMLGFISWLILYYFMNYRPAMIAKDYSMRLKIYFSDVRGLYKGASIRIRGMHVGKVEKMEIKGDRALVTLAIKNDSPIFSDYSVLLNPLNLFGGFYMELNPGNLKKPIISYTMHKLVLSGKSIGDPFNTFGLLLAENSHNIRLITENLREASEKIYDQKGTVGKVLMDERLYRYFLSLVNEARNLVADMRMWQDIEIHDNRRSEWTRSVIPFGTRSLQ